MNSIRLTQVILFVSCLFVVIKAEANEDIARAAQLRSANVELAKNTTVLLADSSSEPSLGEKLYRMVFKRDAKPKEEKKEAEDSKTTTPAPPSDAKPSDDKQPHKGHKGHHKKHKHSHKHHKSDNGTEVDWHSIG